VISSKADNFLDILWVQLRGGFVTVIHRRVQVF
jgi:hypothetical protein